MSDASLRSNRPALPRVLAPLLAILVVASACSQASETDATRDDEGQIAEADDVGVFRLRTGDCVQLPDESQEVETLEGVPCSDPHTGEVIGIHVMSEGADDPFPGEFALSGIAEEVCVEMFDRVTGLDFLSDPDWNMLPLSPSEVSWDTVDDREIVCIGAPLDGLPWTTLLPRV